MKQPKASARTVFQSNPFSVTSSMTKKLFFPFVALFAVFTAAAQNPAAIDQLNNTQQHQSFDQSGKLTYEPGSEAPEIYPVESEDVGPQSVLSIKPRRTWVEGAADAEYYYTDNAFLDHTTRVSSGLLISTAQIALAPAPYQVGEIQLTPRLGFREQWYDFFQYGSHDPNLNTFDFNAQTVFASEQLAWRKWVFGAGLDYIRLLSTSDYRQFYAEYSPHWEVTRPIVITSNQVLSLGYQGYYHFSDAAQFPDLLESGFFNRLDQMFLATYSWKPCDHVVLQPYYTFRYTHFTSSISRDDELHSVGVSAYYFFNKYLSARIFTGYDKRFSSIVSAEYHQFSAGTGVNFTLAL
jgi:hypothetical protein